MDNIDKGIIQLRSPLDVATTADKLESLLAAKHIKLFARIDQAAEAATAGLHLRPTILMIFGDPKAGTPLMDATPSLAIDLPLKALIWEAAPGEVYLSYNSPEYLQQRHGLAAPPLAAISALFAAVVQV